MLSASTVAPYLIQLELRGIGAMSGGSPSKDDLLLRALQKNVNYYTQIMKIVLLKALLWLILF